MHLYMNWQALSFDWNHVRAALATASEGSFSGAARVLRTTQPTIGRQISALEDALGITLFERTVRGPVLTKVGQEMIAHFGSMGDAATMISLAATGQSQDMAGEVTVTASDLMASTILPPIIQDLQVKAPGIRLNILASSRSEDLARRDADIAIRHVRPEEGDLIARHICDYRANFFASTAYLDTVGRPRAVRDLVDHRFIGTSDNGRLISMLNERGVSLVDAHFVTSTNSGPAMWQYLQAGLGIALIPEVLSRHAPDVELVLPDLPSYDFPVWLVTHRELRTNALIRLVFDCLAQRLSALRKND